MHAERPETIEIRPYLYALSLRGRSGWGGWMGGIGSKFQDGPTDVASWFRVTGSKSKPFHRAGGSPCSYRSFPAACPFLGNPHQISRRMCMLPGSERASLSLSLSLSLVFFAFRPMLSPITIYFPFVMLMIVVIIARVVIMIIAISSQNKVRPRWVWKRRVLPMKISAGDEEMHTLCFAWLTW